MENNAIWEYIERKMKITVPKYIKLILMYCGFNDCHAIAAIEHADLQRFVNEVRQGNFTNFCHELGVNDVMGGSREQEENFVFILGHQRLLMAVVNFVRQNLSDCDAYSFSTEEEVQIPSFENSTTKIKHEPSTETKFLKDVSANTLSKYDDDSKGDTNSHEKIDSVHAVHKNIIKHHYTLLTMVVASLSAHTSKMYQQNIDAIAYRLSANLVEVITLNPSDLPQHSAKLTCPYCFDVVTVIYKETWNTSSFDHHLKDMHKDEEKGKIESSKDDIISDFSDLNLIQNTLKCEEYDGQISGQSEEDNISIPNKHDYVLCSLKEFPIQWPSSMPVVKYYVGRVLSVKGTTKINILQRKEHTKFTFVCLKKNDVRTVAREEIIKILETPYKNRRNHLVFKDKILLEI